MRDFLKIKLDMKYRKQELKQLLLIIVIVFISFFISSKLYQIMLIQGNSMMPTYHNMEFAILDKHTKDYTYGDVIAFNCDGLKDILVKRIVACPCDKVEIRNGILYINDEISNIYGDHQLFSYSGIVDNALNLAENEYFVIGDNIEESKDSRYDVIGAISEETIIGRIVFSKKYTFS